MEFWIEELSLSIWRHKYNIPQFDFARRDVHFSPGSDVFRQLQAKPAKQAINASLNFLLSQRHPDGSYGSVYSTALVLQASIVTFIRQESPMYWTLQRWRLGWSLCLGQVLYWYQFRHEPGVPDSTLNYHCTVVWLIIMVWLSLSK